MDLSESIQRSAVKRNRSISEAWTHMKQEDLKLAERVLAHLYTQRNAPPEDDDEILDEHELKALQKDIDMWEKVRYRCKHLLATRPWETDN